MFTAVPDDLLEQLRASPEYAAAWEIELWKQHEMQKVTKLIAETTKKQESAVTEKLKRLELESARTRERKLLEIKEAQEKLRSEQSALDRRAAELVEKEKELNRVQTTLETAKLKWAAENDSKLKMLKEETNVRFELESKRLHEALDANARLQARLESSEKDYSRLWEEFAAFKARQLTEGPVANALASARNDVVTLSAQHDAAMSRLTAEHNAELRKLNNEIRDLNQKILQYKGMCHRVQENMKQLQRKTQEDTERTTTQKNTNQETHQVQRQIKSKQQRTSNKTEDDWAAQENADNKKPQDVVSALLKERDALLATGVYDHSSDVIVLLEKRIEEYNKN